MRPSEAARKIQFIGGENVYEPTLGAPPPPPPSPIQYVHPTRPASTAANITTQSFQIKRSEEGEREQPQQQKSDVAKKSLN